MAPIRPDASRMATAPWAGANRWPARRSLDQRHDGRVGLAQGRDHRGVAAGEGTHGSLALGDDGGEGRRVVDALEHDHRAGSVDDGHAHGLADLSRLHARGFEYLLRVGSLHMIRPLSRGIDLLGRGDYTAGRRGSDTSRADGVHRPEQQRVRCLHARYRPRPRFKWKTTSGAARPRVLVSAADASSVWPSGPLAPDCRDARGLNELDDVQEQKLRRQEARAVLAHGRAGDLRGTRFDRLVSALPRGAALGRRPAGRSDPAIERDQRPPVCDTCACR